MASSLTRSPSIPFGTIFTEEKLVNDPSLLFCDESSNLETSEQNQVLLTKREKKYASFTSVGLHSTDLSFVATEKSNCSCMT